jgi:FkbM family methyltransferase
MTDTELRNRFFKTLLSRHSKDAFFIDVGANLGEYSLFVENVDSLSCLSIEANPKTFQDLRNIIDAKELSHKIDLVNLGAFDKSTTLELKVPIDTQFSGVATFGSNIDAVNEYMSRCGRGGIAYKTVSVACNTLDNIVRDRHPTKNVSAIKADVEGAELFVLKGAVDILKNDTPLILIECDIQHTVKFDYEPSEVLSFLGQFGYEIIWRGASDILLEVVNDK